MKQFKLIISTPQGNMLEKDIVMLSVRGIEGSLAVMANHIPFITTTKEGEVKIYCEDGEEILAAASSGMLTVTKENTTLLCGTFKINE